MKITIALCTRERPGMLAACLSSIQSLKIPRDCELHVVLIENGSLNKCEAMTVEKMKSTPQIGFSYVLEEKLGVAAARNASVKLAVRTNPDWIAFIDDDETVAEDWLVNYVKAIKTDSADVYTGPVEHVVLDKIPIWYKKPRSSSFEHLSIHPTASTGNTIVKASYFDGRIGNYRFDENFSFSGAEDTELFGRISMEGGIIRHVSDAIAYEVVINERTSAKWLVLKEFSFGNNSVRQHINFNGRMSAVRRFYRDFLYRIFNGICFLILGAILLPFSKRSLRYMVKGLKKIAWSIGVCTGFTNIAYDRYKKIEGY